jgi:hypothetical protein
MSKCDVQVLNLLVHYGEHDQKVLLDVLEEGLLKVLIEGPVLETGNPCVAERVRLDKDDSTSVFLTGFFHCSRTLKWRYSRRGSLPEKNPGSKEIYPQSLFMLDLNRHLLFWITQRGESYAPRPSEFKRYVSHYAVEILQKKISPTSLGRVQKALGVKKETE